MRAARAVLALLLWLGGASSARAQKYAATGSLGAGFGRSDSWSDLARDVVPSWDWEGEAALSGAPFRPGTLQFLAGARYRALRNYYFQGRSLTDALAGQLRLSVLSDTAVPISVGASREWGEFTTDVNSLRTGTTLSTNAGGTAMLNVRGYPTLRLGLNHLDLENHSFGVDATHAAATTLSVGAAQSTAGLECSLSYDTGWNSGTWAETNYRSHALNVFANNDVTPDMRFRLSDRYYLRMPTKDVPTNPRYDDNSFGAGVQWHPGQRLTGSLDYGYRHLLVDVLDSPQREQLGHSLTQSTYYRWTPDLSVFGNAGFQFAQERLGGNEAQGASQSLGLGALWRHALSKRWELNLGGGGAAGIAEPTGGNLLFAPGANVSVGLITDLSRLRGSLTYTGSFQRNAGGIAGWGFSQQLNFLAEGSAGEVFLRGTLLLNGARREDPVLGAFFNRSGMMSLLALWRRLNTELRAGIQDGLSDALLNPGFVDGLFLPVGFNTHTRYATLTSTYALVRQQLLLSAVLRALSSTAPGRPEQFEDGASLIASYSIGAFIFSLEERYSVGGTSDMRQSGNLILLRALRTFGATF